MCKKSYLKINPVFLKKIMRWVQICELCLLNHIWKRNHVKRKKEKHMKIHKSCKKSPENEKCIKQTKTKIMWQMNESCQNHTWDMNKCKTITYKKKMSTKQSN